MSVFAMNNISRPASTNGRPTNEDTLTEEEIQFIKNDWKCLGEAKKQKKIVEDVFVFIFFQYEHLRPMWTFGRKPIGDASAVKSNPAFQNHVVNVVNAVTTMVAYLHNDKTLTHFMHDLGSRHFYYDAIEAHYEVLQIGFLQSLHTNRCVGSEWTQQAEIAWRKAFLAAKYGMQNGLRDARFKYMASSMTAQEMVTVKQLWEKVKTHGLKEAGLSFSNAAVRSYEELVNEYGQGNNAEVTQQLNANLISKFSADAMMAINAAIQGYNPDIGFADLPNIMAPFAKEYYFTNASPLLVRKALMEALMNMMTYAVGEVTMTESVQRTWMKLYRMLEQAVIVVITR